MISIAKRCLWCVLIVHSIPSSLQAAIYWDPALGGNGHYYELVSGYIGAPLARNSGKSWADAMWDAHTAPSPLGASFGHLLTINDQAELDFVLSTFGGALGTDVGNLDGAWIGFTDAAEQGRWSWIDGQGGVWEDGAYFSTPVQTAVAPWFTSLGQPTNGLGEHATVLSRNGLISDLPAWFARDLHFVEWEQPPTPGALLTTSIPIAGRGDPQFVQLLAGLPTSAVGGGVLSVYWEDGSDNEIYLDGHRLARSDRSDPLVINVSPETLSEILADGNVEFRMFSGGRITVIEASLTFQYAIAAVPEPSTATIFGIGIATALCGSLVRSRFRQHAIDRRAT